MATPPDVLASRVISVSANSAHLTAELTRYDSELDHVTLELSGPAIGQAAVLSNGGAIFRVTNPAALHALAEAMHVLADRAVSDGLLETLK